MKRASYKDAVCWLAENDDTEYAVPGYEYGLSVAASVIRDIFEVTEKKLCDDILRYEHEKKIRKYLTEN